MGRFLKGLKRGFQKVKKGVSRGIDNVKKGVKNAKKNIAKIGRLVIDAKAQFVNPIPQGEEARQFNKKLKGKKLVTHIAKTFNLSNDVAKEIVQSRKLIDKAVSIPIFVRMKKDVPTKIKKALEKATK